MLSLVLSGLFALAQSAPSTRSAASIAKRDLAADLVTAQAFAQTVSGPDDIVGNWTDSGDDLCSWDGFYCAINPDTNENALASIDFNGFLLTGDLQLDGFLDQLTELALFHANSNGFTGTVPDLSNLPYLYELDLSNNQLSGSFPDNVFTVPAPGLTFLDIRFNSFQGEIPENVFYAYPELQALFINNNQFYGVIPDAIAQFPGNYISMANNYFWGEIPAALAYATALMELEISGNLLQGSIPDGLGALTQLTTFDASNNQLSGTVPEDLCSIQSLQSLNLTSNYFDSELGPACQQAMDAGILTI